MFIIAGLVFNGLHILRLAAETDARAEFQGRPQLDSKPLPHNVNGRFELQSIDLINVDIMTGISQRCPWKRKPSVTGCLTAY